MIKKSLHPSICVMYPSQARGDFIQSDVRVVRERAEMDEQRGEHCRRKEQRRGPGVRAWPQEQHKNRRA